MVINLERKETCDGDLEALPRNDGCWLLSALTLHLSQACPVRLEVCSFFLTAPEKSLFAPLSVLGTFTPSGFGFDSEPSARLGGILRFGAGSAGGGPNLSKSIGRVGIAFYYLKLWTTTREIRE